VAAGDLLIRHRQVLGIQHDDCYWMTGNRAQLRVWQLWPAVCAAEVGGGPPQIGTVVNCHRWTASTTTCHTQSAAWSLGRSSAAGVHPIEPRHPHDRPLRLSRLGAWVDIGDYRQVRLPAASQPRGL